MIICAKMVLSDLAVGQQQQEGDDSSGDNVWDAYMFTPHDRNHRCLPLPLSLLHRARFSCSQSLRPAQMHGCQTQARTKGVNMLPISSLLASDFMLLFKVQCLALCLCAALQS